MRFLADESLESEVVRWLRGLGHDVRSVAEETPSITDSEVLERAVRGNRVLVTNDLDFGAHVFQDGRATAGVILLRLEDESPASKTEALGALLSAHGDRLRGSFVVVTHGRVRFRPLPHR